VASTTQFSQLIQTYPDLGNAWGPVAQQMLSEGQSADQVAGARDAYADCVAQITGNQLASGGGIIPQAAMDQAAQFIQASQTALGAVQSVSGIVNAVTHASNPQAALAAANTITGTLVAAAVALGAVSAGVGALIVAGVGLALEALSDIFGSPPPFNVCGTGLDTKPSIVVGCAFSMTAVQVAPNATAWRTFPDTSAPSDAGWYDPPANVTSSIALELGNNSPIITWHGDVWYGGTYNAADDGDRLIDRAFPNYHAAVELQLPASTNTSTFADFQRFYIGAWTANQAFALNGLQPQSDFQLLLHVVAVWNRAHVGPSAGYGAGALPIGPTSTGIGIDYIAGLTSALSTTFEYDSPDNYVYNGALQVYLGDPLLAQIEAQLKAEALQFAIWKANGIPCNTWAATSADGQKALLAAGYKPIAGCPSATSPSALASTSLGKVALGGAAVVGASALGVGVYALATSQTFFAALKGIFGGIVKTVNPLPAAALGVIAAEEAPQSTTVQTLIFPKSKYSESRAKAWSMAHGYVVHKTDVTSQSIRIRQRPPSKFQKGSLRTISFGRSGIRAVIGHLKDPSS
jgi:hypothetical protein